jgi:UPF0755 protein
LGLGIFISLAALAILAYYNSPPVLLPNADTEYDGMTLEYDDSLQTAARFDVRRGESAQSVGIRLAESGLIRSRYLWQLLCRYDKEPIKSGTYQIELPASQLAIHRLLISGRQMLLRVTVPEGLTVSKTARLFEEAGVCPADDFIAAASDPAMAERCQIPGASMEGYLFPDTYLFPSGYPAERVVQHMADNFFSRIGTIDEKIRGMTADELNRMVILASIVEREYRINEEAPLMAGVFFNRLDVGMALQSCATVEYIITEIQGLPHPEFLTMRDTEIRDPYNTYIRPGLPPGPIASPGAVAIKAVLFPEKSSYLYFRLVDEASGRHYFSNTFDEHIRAGKLYVKGQ